LRIDALVDEDALRASRLASILKVWIIAHCQLAHTAGKTVAQRPGCRTLGAQSERQSGAVAATMDWLPGLEPSVDLSLSEFSHMRSAA
jgi:hypothetical protein